MGVESDFSGFDDLEKKLKDLNKKSFRISVNNPKDKKEVKEKALKELKRRLGLK